MAEKPDFANANGRFGACRLRRGLRTSDGLPVWRLESSQDAADSERSHETNRVRSQGSEQTRHPHGVRELACNMLHETMNAVRKVSTMVTVLLVLFLAGCTSTTLHDGVGGTAPSLARTARAAAAAAIKAEAAAKAAALAAQQAADRGGERGTGREGDVGHQLLHAITARGGARPQ